MIGTQITEFSALRFPPTSHICGFYETEEEHRALVTPFLLQGLERGERVVYITDAHSAGTILEYLRDGGMDIGAVLARGQLVFRTAQDTYLRDNRFDPDRMLAFLRTETEQALADGFTGLRATGEMTWALRGMPGSELLSQYEARVNELLPDLPFTGLCQYDRRQFGPEFLIDLLWCHPLVASGGQVYENHRYVPRGDLSDVAYSEARVRRWLEDLAERQQVEDLSRRLSAALVAVARPARQMAAFLDQDTLLREVVRSVQAVTGAYNANVFLLTDAGLVLAAGHGGYEDGRPPIGYRLEVGQGIIGTVAQTGRPLLVPDVRQDSRYLYYEGLPHTRSELAVPVKSGEQVLAVLDVQSTTPDAFDRVALEALSALADQLAVALENARLFGELSRRLQEMSALHDNALRLAETSSLDELLEAILQRAMALLRARGGGIYFYDPVADGLEWVVGQGIGRENVGVRLRPGEGLSGRALQERRPLKVDDYRTWEGRSPLFEGQPLGAVAAVPLLWQEESIGVLTVSRTPDQPPFSEDDMRLLTLFGQQAASAIATARACEAAERRARQQAVVNEIGQALAAAPDLPALYRAARDGVRRLVDAPVFGISFFDPQSQTITAAFMAEGDTELDVSQFPPLAHVPDAPTGRSRAIATGQPELIPDLSPAYEEGKAVVVGGEPYALSALYVPMVVEGQTIGLVEVQSYRRAAYTPEDAALLQTVANQIGLAIQNARFLQEARRLAAFNAEIVNSLAEGIILTDDTGYINFVNSAAARLLGYEPPELTGQHRNTVLPPDQRPIVQAATRRRRRGVSDRYELELLRKDGRRVPVLVSGVPRFDEAGRFVGSLAVFTDISERKRAEEALRRYAERLQVLRTLDAAILVAQSPEEVAREALRYVRRLVPCNGAGVVTYQPATREGIVLAGDADREIPIGAGFRFPLVGVDREIEASQRGEVLLVPDISALPAPSLAEQALLTAGVRACIAVPLRAGGGLRGWLAVASATPGTLTAEHVEILQEVSAQLAVALYQADLRAALAAQEARLSALVERLPEGVLLLDGDHRILLTNRAAEEFLPLLTDARRGDVLTHLVSHSLGEFLVVPAGNGWHEVAIPHLRRIFQLAARPISGIGPNGGWVLVIRDVTQERFLQEQLEQQERLAAVGQLASGIAHDFNNLLTTTILYAQMALESPDLPSDLAQSLQVIIGESRQATQLVQQILDFSRRAPMEARPMDLAPFLKEVTKVLERVIPENVRLRLVTRAGPFTVQGDPTRLRQAVINMVLNARDAMPQGGEVRLGLSRLTVGPKEPPPLVGMEPGEWVCLEVADTGTGIPSEVLPHIFEPFFTTKPRGVGTGLGLAQVYGIVQQHGGHIGVETEVGKGTTFRVYLPALVEEAPALEPTAEGPIPTGRGETVLLVEDHPALRAAGRAVLERLGYRVLEAADGREALEVYAAERVDLVLTDVVMPGMGGAALVEALRQQNPDVKVVAVTGYGEDQEVERIRQAGVSEIIRKPFEVERLAEVIRRMLG